MARITAEIRHEIHLDTLLREIQMKADSAQRSIHSGIQDNRHEMSNLSNLLSQIHQTTYHAINELRAAQAQRDRPWWRKLIE